MQYIVPEDQRFAGQITQVSNTRYIEVIMQNFDEDHKAAFRETCFAHFELLQNRQLKFSGKLVHQMILRMVHSNKVKETWFKVNGRLARFGMQEYALMTGLMCHGTPRNLLVQKVLLKHRLRRKWLFNLEHISLNQLEAAFVACDHHGDKYKLGLALLIEGVCRPVDRRSISLETLSLVDKLNVFYEYPWGRDCYFAMLKSLNCSWNKRAEKANAKDNGLLKYTLGGFPISFQFWVYEAFPEIGAKFGENMGDTFPRILKWDAHMQPQTSTFVTFFSGTEIQAITTLRPTEHEATQPYIVTLALPKDATNDYLDKLVHEEQFQDSADDAPVEFGHVAHHGRAAMGNLDFIRSPRLDASFYDQTHISSQQEMPTSSVPQQNMHCPMPKTNYMHSSSQFVPPSYTGHITSEQMSTIFAEQRTYFDAQISSVRSGIFDQCEQLEGYIDNKLKAMQANHIQMFESLRDDLQKELRDCFGNIEGMLQELMVVHQGQVNNGTDDETIEGDEGATELAEDVDSSRGVSRQRFVPALLRSPYTGGQRKRRKQSGISLPLHGPILCDINKKNKKRDNATMAWLQKAKKRDALEVVNNSPALTIGARNDTLGVSLETPIILDDDNVCR
ncbi:DUF1985 domain-containing protein [Abeliophyllum distichum]|uniref:DUF1985 domain-containing protein n=1 Tax=Abeliophyllum distichum TaxID=126358 RepID=A0ABD1PT48_9LAMI